MVEHDAVHATSDLGYNLDVMSTYSQLVAYSRSDARFHFEGLTLGPDARGLNGFLECHAVVDDIDDRLQHRGEDTRTTRSAQGHERAATSEHDSGGHAAQHAFPRRNGVGPLWVWVEDVHGVIEHNTSAWYGDLGAKCFVDGLGHGYHIASSIRYRQVSGVSGGTPIRPGVPGIKVARALQVDLSPTCHRIKFGDQATHGDFHESWVAEILKAVGKGDLQSLSEDMD